MSEGKNRLLELEKTGQYLFHGSGNDIEIFEPRQAYDWATGVKEKDQEPAVFASPALDYAIFMAIFNKKNCPKGFTSGAETKSENTDSDKWERIIFSTDKHSMEQLQDSASGFVYIFNKDDFPRRKRPTEYFRTDHIKPLERISVFKEDLPEKIEIVADKIR